MELTQIDSQQDDYLLTCAKCQHDGGSGICLDGVWFFDSKNMTQDETQLSSLFCCTGCISWFRRNSRDWFQDDIQRDWFRFTKSEIRKWGRESWVGSEEKSAEFVEHVIRKQSNKRSQKKTKKTARTSSVDNASFDNAASPSATTPKLRKRKRAVVVDPEDSASLASASNVVMERYNPKTTFASFQQGIKTLHAFLNMCNNTAPGTATHIPESVHTIVTMQVGLLESLMETLKEHIR